MTAPFELATTPLPAGAMLLEASAGTGKTFTITGIVLRLLLDGRISRLSEALVVTYTIAATQELKTRIRKALQQAEAACAAGRDDDPFLDGLAQRHGERGAVVLRQALRQIDELSVATIHSFCKRVLDEAAFASGSAFGADLVAEDAAAMLEAAQDAVRIEVQGKSRTVAELAVQHNLLPKELISDYRLARRHRGTRLQPEPQDLEPALATIVQLRDELRALARSSQLPIEELRATPWKQKPEAFWRQRLPTLQGDLLDDGPAARDIEARLTTARWDEDRDRRKKVGSPPDHPALHLCGRLAELTARAGHDLRARLFAQMDRRLLLHKQRAHTMGFDDLLVRVHDALHDERRAAAMREQIRSRWQIAVIDEFQDTDQIQYEVFRACFADRGLYLVGDPKQSIYAFRGADLHAYLEARGDAASQYTLAQNYRSSPDAVAAAGALFGRPNAFCEEGIELPKVTAALPAARFAVHGDAGKALQIRLLDLSSKTDSKAKDQTLPWICADVAAECVRLLNDPAVLVEDQGTPRRLRPRDFAVLTRSHEQARAIQEALRQRQVHAAVGKAGDVFQCPEFDDLLGLLHAWSRPGDMGALRACWTTPLFGLDAPGLRRLLQDDACLHAALQRFENQRQTLHKSGVLAAILETMQQEELRRRLLERPDGERKLTNYLQVAELLHRAERTFSLHGPALRAWLLHERHAAEQVDAEWRELRLESDADAVQILTTHASKGLQYEIVFAPFFWDAKRDVPAKRPILVREPDGGFVLHMPGSPDRTAALRLWRQQSLAEDLRLLYVAVTRARRRCILHALPSKEGRHSPLAYLLFPEGASQPTSQPGSQPDGQPGSPSERASKGKPKGKGKSKAAAEGQADDNGTPTAALSLSDWRIAASALADREPTAIECIETAATARAGAPYRSAASRQSAGPRPLPERIAQGWRTTSFTQLVRRDGADGKEQELLDEAAGAEPALDEPDAEAPAPTEQAQCRGFFAFARGAQAGICLHEILEKVDFSADEPATRAAVQRILQGHGLDQAGAHRGEIEPVQDTTAMLQRLFALQLPDFGFSLRELSRRDCAPEWRFLAQAGSLSPNGLSDVFAASPALPEYAQNLRRLSPHRMQGFLNGSVDLLAAHDGRYYVFDWKSNWLGPTAADYAPDKLQLDMQEQDYVLQYHLYLLAVHRHLQTRLLDYDYDRHIGGACYVYLRGIAEPADAGRTGLYFDRPDRARIEALERWLGQGSPR